MTKKSSHAPTANHSLERRYWLNGEWKGRPPSSKAAQASATITVSSSVGKDGRPVASSPKSTTAVAPRISG